MSCCSVLGEALWVLQSEGGADWHPIPKAFVTHSWDPFTCPKVPSTLGNCGPAWVWGDSDACQVPLSPQVCTLPAGLTVNDVDIFEINEAFASQVSLSLIIAWALGTQWEPVDKLLSGGGQSL